MWLNGFISENYAVTTEAFCLQDADFKLGKDLDASLEPQTIPNQLLYCSSASGEDSYFYKAYKEYSKMMFAGSNNHFVADIDCEVVIGATNHGVQLPVPLLSREKVEQALKVNKEKAMRVIIYLYCYKYSSVYKEIYIGHNLKTSNS